MSARYKLPDPKCRHARKGIVTAGDPVGAYAATNVCDRAACVDDAIEWATAMTHEPAVHRPDRVVQDHGEGREQVDLFDE